MAAKSNRAAAHRSVRTSCLALVVLLNGCVSSPPAPALLATPDVQTSAELSRIISKALGGAPVTLADDALTQSPTLSIDHPNLRDTSGLPIDGRRQSVPATFALSTLHHQCFITDLRTGRQWTLSHARCTRVS